MVQWLFVENEAEIAGVISLSPFKKYLHSSLVILICLIGIYKPSNHTPFNVLTGAMGLSHGTAK